MRFDLTIKMRYAHLCVMENASDIKLLRKRLGWQQSQMAEYLGVDRTSVSHFENGREISGPVRKLLENLSNSIGAASLQQHN
jgi:transcriptional regulator with XRE-family HTH domain